MQYALLTAGAFRLLVTRPDTNAYGNATLNMATSFHLAKHLGTRLYTAPVNPAQHNALTSLDCDGVRRMRTSSLRTRIVLACARGAAVAARAGLPGLRVVGTLAGLGKDGSGTPEERAYFGVDLRRSYATLPLNVHLPDEAERETRRRAASLGLDDRSSIVTLHVRESAYKASLGYVDREKDEARNAKIETYLEAIDWLVSRGYTVVRFGDPLMTPIKHPGVVDLATSPVRTPELEIWCVLHSRFLIASDCGPFNLSVLTGVPCLGVNMTHLIGAYPLRPHDRYILKHVDDLQTGRELTLGEMLTPGHMKLRWVPGRYAFRDNTSTEIREAVEEMERALSVPPAAAIAQRAFRDAMSGFLKSDYGRKKSQKTGTQPDFYLGDGWVGEAFARQSLGLPVSV